MNKPDRDVFDNIREDVKDMAGEGFSHPGSKQVLTGAAVGAVAGAVLPIVSWPIGLVAGAAFMLYKRARK